MSKKYWLRLTIGSILFGVFTFGSEVYNGGLWDWKSLWLVLFGVVTFGILFHVFHVLFSFIFKRMTKK